MNDKLKRLVLLCTEETGDYQFGSIPQLNPEKFAELIIRECLSIMENCDGDLDFAIYKTKKDFGVE